MSVHCSPLRFASVLLAVADSDGGSRRLCLSLSWRMKVKIRQWNGVASWLWVANDENCGICRMAFNGCCPECEYAKLTLA